MHTEQSKGNLHSLATEQNHIAQRVAPKPLAKKRSSSMPYLHGDMVFLPNQIRPFVINKKTTVIPPLRSSKIQITKH